jgi:hypothetical protein
VQELKMRWFKITPWLWVVGSLITAGAIYQVGFSHPLVVRVTGLPNARMEPESGTLRFSALQARHWWSDEYGYFMLECREGSWTALRNRFSTGSPRMAMLYLRIHGHYTQGQLKIGKDVDGFLAFWPMPMEAGWKLIGGSVAVKLGSEQDVVSTQVALERIYPGPARGLESGQSPGETLSLSDVGFHADPGTAINMFTPVTMQFVPGIRGWLEDDPALEKFLPPSVSPKSMLQAP